MTFCIRVRARRVEGVLLRVLGALHRCGHEPQEARCELVHDGREFDIHLCVNSERRADIVVRQLSKLYDVVHAELVVASNESLPRPALAGSSLSSDCG